MKGLIRGYVDAVLEETEPADTTASLADELAAVRAVIEGSDDLRSVLDDPGVAAHVRRAVVGDLFGSRVSGDALRLLQYCIDVDRATELVDDVAWLAERVAAARDELTAVGPATLGRHAALERLDGYAAAVLGPIRDDGEGSGPPPGDGEGSGPPPGDGIGALADVEDELFRFARTVEGYPNLLEVLTGPEQPPGVRSGVVTSLLSDKATPATTRLAAYAARIGRPRDYLDLLDAVVARVSLETRRRIAEVRAAAELTADQERRLAGALGALTGQDVEVRVVVDRDVLGGFVATMGDAVVDASVRHRLDLLRERLAASEAPFGNNAPGAA